MSAPPVSDSDPRPVLIFGCGYLGLRAARVWVAAGRRVVALTRGKRAGELSHAGIEPIVGDICDPGTLPHFPAASTVLYAVGLDRTAGRSMREVYTDGLRNVLARLPTPTRLLHVSSTSVYGQTDGAPVTETSPTEPTEESGKVVLEAENLVRSAMPDAIVLRFAGIYGPGRVLRRQALLAGEPLVGDAEKWLNLIHVEDGVRALLAAETRGRPGETYLVSDGTPVTRRDFYTHAANLIGAPPAAFDHRPASGEPNRQIDSRKLREECGFSPMFPTFREGLADSC